MRTDDTSSSLDRYDDGEEPEFFGLDGAAPDSPDRMDDPDADPDEALLEAELGEHDIAVDDDIDLGDDLDDEPADDAEDDREMLLLQEFGLDLDATDDLPDGLDLMTDVEDATLDDEVAA